MSQKTTSCQYVPFDVQKLNLPLIHGQDVSLDFEGKVKVHAIQQVDFAIQQNKITAIIGESGSGKTTLLKLIYGLLAPETGEIRYKGWLVPTRKDKLIPGHEAMKLVSQGFDDLNQYAKVWDNVASQLSNTNLALKESKTKEVLKKLRINHLAQQRVADLSGGEKQRVAISRALINEPEVLLMDEPFNQVDAAFRDSLQQDIRTIVEETGLTIIIVSHDPTEVLALADELLVMKNGKIVEQGKPSDLYYHPKHPYTGQLLAKCNILTPEQASALGLDVQKTIGIHQENIEIRENPKGNFWVKEVKFRGFYRELFLGNDELTVNCIQYPKQEVKKNTRIDILVKYFIEF
ncbi:ABC transporter ATP-binding protein [Sphingobacterium hungaricum]